MKDLQKIGFTKNTKNFNGFRPHYKRNNELLFLIGSDFWCGKICDIKHAFKDSSFSIFGILTEKSPYNADKDWVTADFTLLKLEPLSKGQWSSAGDKLEYVSIKL